MEAQGKVGEAALEVGVALTAQGDLLVKRGGRVPDRIALGADPPAPVRVTAGITAVRQGGKDHAVLQVKAAGEDQHLEAALWLDGKRLILIWVGTTGAHGDFGSWTRELSVTSRGVAVHQATRALSRCDGLPARMLTVGYHFGSKRLLPVLLDPPVKEGAVELTATMEPPAGARPEPLAPFRFESASSELGCQGEASQVTPPSELHDGRPGTAWVEGRGGPGRWEFVTARAPGVAHPVRALRILPGHGGSMETLKAHNRLKRFWVILGPKHRYRVTVPQDPLEVAGAPATPFWVVLPASVPSGCVTLVIEDVYPGSSGDTAISEVTVFTTLDFGDPLRGILDAVTAGRMEPEEAARTLVNLGPGAIPALRKALLAAASEAEQAVLLRVLGRLDPRGSVDVLSKALRGAEASLRRDLLRALEEAGELGVPALAAVMDAKPNEELAKELAASLARVGSPLAADALLDRLGAEGRERRRILVGALARFPVAHVRPALWARLARKEGTEAQSGDLLRLLRALTGRHADLMGEASSLLLTIQGHIQGFEGRYRLLELMGQLGDARFAPFLVELLRSKDDPILRELAALALGRSQWPKRQAAIRQALADPSPRVRRGAALAWALDVMARRSAADETLPAVLALAEGDPWSLVREASLGALSEACPAAAFPALLRMGARPGSTQGARTDAAIESRTLTRSDAGAQPKTSAKPGSRTAKGAHSAMNAAPRGVRLHLRRLALLASLRCRVPGLGALFGDILKDGDERTAMRSLAVRLLAELGDVSQVPYMTEFLALLAREVERPRTRNESFAVDIAASLGRLKDPRALPALRQAAAVERLPQLRASALEALGAFCRPEDREIVKVGEGSKNRVVGNVASRTMSRCGW